MPPLMEINVRAKKAPPPTDAKGALAQAAIPFVPPMSLGTYIAKDGRKIVVHGTYLVPATGVEYVRGKLDGFAPDVYWTTEGKYVGHSNLIPFPAGHPTSSTGVGFAVDTKIFLTADEAWDWWQHGKPIRYASRKQEEKLWAAFPSSLALYSREQFDHHFTVYIMRKGY